MPTAKGPINTNNKCALRTLRDTQGRQLGTVVMPKRGTEAWSDSGFTNPGLVPLRQGVNTLRLDYEPANTNMNGTTNQALLGYVRLIRLQ